MLKVIIKVIYCEGLEEAKKIKEKINDLLINDKFENYKIEIKHGCTEYYKSYPKFQNVNLKEMKEVLFYDENWKKKRI